MHGDLFRPCDQDPAQKGLRHLIVHLRGGRTSTLHNDHQLFRPQGTPCTALPTSNLQERLTETPHLQLLIVVGSMSWQQHFVFQGLGQVDSLTGQLHSRCILRGTLQC